MGQRLIIYWFAVNMQYFKKDRKQILFQVLEFQIVQGATFWDTQLAPSKFNMWAASGQLLISNTDIKEHYWIHGFGILFILKILR